MCASCRANVIHVASCHSPHPSPYAIFCFSFLFLLSFFLFILPFFFPSSFLPSSLFFSFFLLFFVSFFFSLQGGCRHMTCVCGHQFCWDCLQDWNGYYHSQTLFPPPSRLRETCNSSRMWAMRCGIVVGAPVAFSLLLPVGVLGLLLYPTGLTTKIARRIDDWL